MNPAVVGDTFGDDVAVVLVADIEADQSAAADLIRRTCQLTHAEADLARLLAEGLSLEEISRERGVTMNTTRTHLKHVFAKTGTSRQSELVGKLLAAALPQNE
jgi:DNA-binding CsgD family transcriptional regulator